jgi:hypothetical protein
MVLGSGIRDPRSGIRDPEKTYSGSRIQGSISTQSRIPDPDPQHCFSYHQHLPVSYFFFALRTVASTLQSLSSQADGRVRGEAKNYDRKKTGMSSNIWFIFPVSWVRISFNVHLTQGFHLQVFLQGTQESIPPASTSTLFLLGSYPR